MYVIADNLSLWRVFCPHNCSGNKRVQVHVDVSSSGPLAKFFLKPTFTVMTLELDCVYAHIVMRIISFFGYINVSEV